MNEDTLERDLGVTLEAEVAAVEPKVRAPPQRHRVLKRVDAVVHSHRIVMALHTIDVIAAAIVIHQELLHG